MDEERNCPADDHESHSSHRKTRWRDYLNDCVLAYKTLGIVFGGLVTSPLYVYPSMNLKSPTKDDYMAIYSIMFWTLTLIGVVKYVCIALNADDHGEGGTFALYSLLCRHADVGILPSREEDAARNTSNNLTSGRKPTKVGKFFEQSLIARRLLLFLAISGVCMLIGDGILTPAISVLSAMDGLRGPLPSVNKSIVEALSAVVLVFLFMLQKHGTSRMSFLFSPIMAIWTLTTPLIGIYSVAHYEPTIFKALSPHYIVRFFLANGKRAWQLLSGTVLCITGAEAMFADLGHFNKRSIQMAFLFAKYPSLVLTYAGQTAYLIHHPGDHSEGFYKFVPSAVYWPVFLVATLAAVVASQSLISATFSVIKQSVSLDYFPRVKVVHTSPNKEGEVYPPEINYLLMFLSIAIILVFGDGPDIGNAFGVVVIMVMVITTILLTLVMVIVWRTPLPLAALYLGAFSALEGAYVSAVLTKIPEGGWLPFTISIILAFVMFGWYTGRKKKMQYETRNKITAEDLALLLSEPHRQRVPGVCFFYSNIQDGLTPVLGHYIKNARSLHEVTVFTTLRYSLVAKVAERERVAVRPLGPRGTFSCAVQFGYADQGLEGGELVARVMDELTNGLAPAEAATVDAARSAGVVHVRGKTRFYVGKGTSLYDRVMLGFYEFLRSNCRSGLPTRGVPLRQRMEVGMLYEA
ncbi:putative potassium transporter 17 [Wolffia australiana]